MGYWTILIFCSVVLAVLITITWYSVKKQNDRSELGCEMGVIVAISFAVFALVLDIPSAIMGGKKIYVDEFPPTVTLQYFQFVKTESEYLISFKNFNSDKYEKMRNIAFHTQHLRRMCLI